MIKLLGSDVEEGKGPCLQCYILLLATVNDGRRVNLVSHHSSNNLRRRCGG